MKMNRREPCCFSRYVARTTFAVVNNLYCVPAYVVWTLALRSIRPFSASLYWKIEGILFHWLLAMVSMWSWTAGYEIVESGDEPSTCYGQRTLIIANHQSTADVPMLMAAWNPRPGVLANLMWIMDRLFKYTNFGLVSYLHQDFFIQAGRNTRDQSLLDLRNHMHGYYIPLQRQFIVLFPEGGFFYKRKEISMKFAEKNNLPKLDYVTVPRVGAMKVIMEEAGPQSTTVKDSGDKIQWILDVTIAYEDRKPLHLQDVVCGFRDPCTTHMHYRLYPSTDVPSDPEGMTTWLYDRFIEKDKMLEEFYRTGHFPSRGSSPQHIRPVRQDNFRFLLLHIFYIFSTYLHIRFICFIFRWLMGY